MNPGECAKILEQELMQFAQECKDAGLRVFFLDSAYHDLHRTYFHASNGTGVVCVESAYSMYSGFNMFICRDPKKGHGTGCWHRGAGTWISPQAQDVVNACHVSDPYSYKDVNEWLEAEKEFSWIITEL